MEKEGEVEEGKEGQEVRVHALDCPSVRLFWTVGPWYQRMDGSQITCISDSLVERSNVFPDAVINYDRNRRIRARIVGHGGRRRLGERL